MRGGGQRRSQVGRIVVREAIHLIKPLERNYSENSKSLG